MLKKNMNINSKSFLLTGGVRSGKSTYALNLANNRKNPYFIATAWNGDNEMEKRIMKHKAERGNEWTTIEEQLNISSAILKAAENNSDFIIVDCIGAWITNIMIKHNIDEVNNVKEIKTFLNIINEINIPIAIVTNEVGMGLIPDNKMGRNFRDNIGFVNKEIAYKVSNVIFMVSGLPMLLKGRL